MNEVKAVLVEARKRVAAGWTQGAYARTATGRPIGVLESPAACWCLIGAIERAAYELRNHRLINPALSTLCKESWALPGWNDAPERTQADVLALIDRAIEGQPDE